MLSWATPAPSLSVAVVPDLLPLQTSCHLEQGSQAVSHPVSGRVPVVLVLVSTRALHRCPSLVGSGPQLLSLEQCAGCHHHGTPTPCRLRPDLPSPAPLSTPAASGPHTTEPCPDHGVHAPLHGFSPSRSVLWGPCPQHSLTLRLDSLPQLCGLHPCPSFKPGCLVGRGSPTAIRGGLLQTRVLTGGCSPRLPRPQALQRCLPLEGMDPCHLLLVTLSHTTEKKGHRQ